jgi:hypothetical protein
MLPGGRLSVGLGPEDGPRGSGQRPRPYCLALSVGLCLEDGDPSKRLFGENLAAETDPYGGYCPILSALHLPEFSCKILATASLGNYPKSSSILA